MTDIVNLLKAKAELAGWKPVVGTKDIQNYSISLVDLTDESSALMIDLPTSKPEIENGFWSRYNEQIELMLVRKTEGETISSNSETSEQKYNTRLFELQNDLDDFLKDVFGCAAKIEVKSISYNYMLNVLTASVDGVFCVVNYLSW